MPPYSCIDSLVNTLHRLAIDSNLSHLVSLHAYTCTSGLEAHKLIRNHLVLMLIEAAGFYSADIVFERLRYQNVCFSNSVLAASAKDNGSQNPLNLFQKMRKNSIRVFREHGRAFVTLVKTCADMKKAHIGSELHVIIAKYDFLQLDLFICNSLVDMYAKCGLLAKAKIVFEEISTRDIVSWNALLGGYAKHQYGQEALKCFEQMQVEGVFPNVVTFVCIFKASGSIGSAGKGCEIHAKIVYLGFLGSNLVLGNALIDVYAKCGLFMQAQNVFDGLPMRDAVSWNALIAGYVKHADGERALCCFEYMQIEHVRPSIITLTCTLKACGMTGASEMGIMIHALTDREGFLEKGPIIGIALVDMYAKCGIIERAHEVLNMLSPRDALSWTALIGGYVKQGYAEEAVTCFEQMQQEGISPNAVTYVCSLKAYAMIGAIKKGAKLHDELLTKGWLEKDVIIGNSLIDMYADCQLFSKAQEVFDRIPFHDVVSWTALMTGYLKHDHADLALNCFRQMHCEGIFPNEISFVCSLKACGINQDLGQGKVIHSTITGTSFLEHNLAVGNALVGMYAKCNCLVRAKEVFDLLLVHDVVSWTALIGGYVAEDCCEEALNCFEQMQVEGISPNSITYVCSLQACGSLRYIDKGIEIHADIMRVGFFKRDLTGNSLVDMYAKCGALAKAREVFDNLIVQDVVSWTSLIAGYASHDCGEKALACFQEMQSKGVSPNSVTLVCILRACGSIGAIDEGSHIHDQILRLNILESEPSVGSALVEMYAKLDFFEKAQRIFDQLALRNILVWNALIAGYAEHDYGKEVLDCFEQMELEGVSPDATTIVCCLKACGSVGASEKGYEIHSEISRKGMLEGDIVVGNALVGMYARCGMIAKAQEMFDRLPVQDVVAWSTLIAGYAHLGESETVFRIFEKMKREGRTPDLITYISVLNACSQSMLVDKGQSFFESIREDYGVSPTVEHHTCMVSLLSHAGHLQSAIEMAKEMPSFSDMGVWHCILSACTKWGNLQLGKLSFEKAMQLDEKDAAAYLRICRIYAEAEF